MKDAFRTTSTIASTDEYRTLLAISDALITHRDLAELLRDLAGRLRQIVEFEFL